MEVGRMIYALIAISCVCVFVMLRLCFLEHSIHKAVRQMEEISRLGESNRKLQAITNDRHLEKLLQKINTVYQTQQKERIRYQRKEDRIRMEIENISHDLRTPLTSIMGYVELIKDPATKESERTEYLDIIHKRARVLQGFIEDFYELSRIEGEDYPITYEIIAVQPALKEAVVSYYQQFEKKQIKVDIQLEEKPCSIIAGRMQFYRILNNLIQNALKYAHTFFTLKQFTENGECVILFQNDNSQLKQKDMDNIFERFYTGDESRKGQSTGLGLTIAKMLAENMRGKICASLDNGIFTIELRWRLQL
jgi:signal transduction histidine kinase